MQTTGAIAAAAFHSLHCCPSEHTKTESVHKKEEKEEKVHYLQTSFSSKFPLDVTESALMNSSNSMEPSCFYFFYLLLCVVCVFLCVWVIEKKYLMSGKSISGQQLVSAIFFCYSPCSRQRPERRERQTWMGPRVERTACIFSGSPAQK